MTLGDLLKFTENKKVRILLYANLDNQNYLSQDFFGKYQSFDRNLNTNTYSQDGRGRLVLITWSFECDRAIIS